MADSEREKVLENLKSENFNVLELLDGTFVAQGKVIATSKKSALPAGFEPTRGDPIGFQVQRLNHSATTAC